MAIRKLADGTLQDTKTGQMAGKVGAGKAQVPTPAVAGPGTALPAAAPPAGVTAEEAVARWQGRPVRLGYPQWAEALNYRYFSADYATEWDADYVLSRQTERDSLARVGTDRSTDCARDTLTGALRAERIEGSEWVDEHRQRNSFYRIPAVGTDVDGSVPAFLYSHDDRKVVQRISWGMLSPDGVFTSSSSADQTFASIVSSESVLQEHAGGDIEDFMFAPLQNAAGEPAALEFRARSEWYDDSGPWD